MSQEVGLSEDGNRAIQEAQNFCSRANVAIVAADHLLAGALAVLADGGDTAVPARAALEAALMLTQAAGDETLSQQVMFGSSARDAINDTARKVRESGGTTINARTIALGTIDSGEVNPMFYGSLGVTRMALRAAIGGNEG